jgi:uncharacterized protein YbjT (DUF2867 family)
VEVVELNWVDISPEWLQEHEVARAFIASAVQPTLFTEESKFHVALLDAGVKYVVRISTTAANVRPDNRAFYARNHWAIEAMLSSPEFETLHWTSLQPNPFTALTLYNAAELIKNYRKTGKVEEPLRLIDAEDTPMAPVASDDVGTVAGHLLLQEDTSVHNKARYTVNGPVDLTGRDIVNMVEEHIGTKVQNVSYKDLTFIDYMIAGSSENKNVMRSIKHAPETAWAGLCTAKESSKEVIELAAPKTTPADVLRAMTEG